MLAAGVGAFAEAQRHGEDAEKLVTAVYTAMSKASGFSRDMRQSGPILEYAIYNLRSLAESAELAARRLKSEFSEIASGGS